MKLILFVLNYNLNRLCFPQQAYNYHNAHRGESLRMRTGTFGGHLFRLDCWSLKPPILIYWPIPIDHQMHSSLLIQPVDKSIL